jgi:beta-glucosidase
MIKHFPGDGCGESGRESHNQFGKFCVYPGENMEAQLIPFVDGGLHLDSSTGECGAFMDSYSIAYSDVHRHAQEQGRRD